MIDKLLRRFLRLLAKGFETFWIIDCHFGEHLAVNLDAVLVEAIDETRIADAIHSASGVDTLDPKLAIISLDLAAGDISVSPAV